MAAQSRKNRSILRTGIRIYCLLGFRFDTKSTNTRSIAGKILPRLEFVLSLSKSFQCINICEGMCCSNIVVLYINVLYSVTAVAREKNRSNFTKNLLWKYDRMRLFVSFSDRVAQSCWHFCAGASVYRQRLRCRLACVTKYRAVECVPFIFHSNKINEKASNEIVNGIILIYLSLFPIPFLSLSHRFEWQKKLSE